MRSKDFSYREVIHLIAYTDGSYRKKANGDYGVGWGYVILDGDTVVHEAYGTTDEYTSMRNVVGECMAVVEAIIYCEEQGFEEITIYHDYIGAGAWIQGQWKTKNEMTKRYKKFVLDSPMRIEFVHVKGHDGNKWNEYVDKLAVAARLKED